jgi:hypothetical protein
MTTLSPTASLSLRPERLTPWRNRFVTYSVLFVTTFILLFLGMDRGFDFYDEGINLVDAMRVAAGQVPHRDFYVNYGPAQFYTLAWLFHLFGPSVFVERMYDLALRSAIVTVTWAILASRCKRWVAVCTTVVCGFWLFSSGVPTIAYSIIPILLLVLLGSVLLLPMFSSDLSKLKAILAGCTAGLVTLFRYDVGFALVVVHLSSILIAASLRKKYAEPGLRQTLSTLSFYALGVAILFLPPALLYLSVAPIHPFVHDVIIYPAKYYARARSLPFPGLRWRSLENIAIYIPVVVAVLCLYTVVTTRMREGDPFAGPADLTRNQGRIGFFVLFGLLGTALYFKGVVRVSVAQMLLSILITIIPLAMLFDYTAGKWPRLHRLVQWTMVLSVFAATWSALKEVRVLYLNHSSVLQEILSPSGPASIRSETAWCGVPNRLHTGLCFLVDPSHIDAISYLGEHSKPSERIFVGLSRHDRLVSNDLLTYFASDRLPATRWAQFDPDLQTRADIQNAMIRELEDQKIRHVILESQFDAQVEPRNDSSRSSGVTLLDEYIRQHYRLLETTGAITIWSRHEVAP